MAKRNKKKRYQKRYVQKPQPQIPTHQEDSLDVVMPIHGEMDFLEKSLPSIIEATKASGLPTKYYFVETNSTKKMEVRKYINDYWKENGLDPNDLALSIMNDKIGYVGGCNYGAKRGKGKYILITTTDVVFEQMAVERMINTIQSAEDIGIVGAKLLFPEGSPHGHSGTIQHAGLECDVRAKIHHIFIGWSADHPKVNERRDCLAVTGATFLTYRYLWDQLGGYDTAYGLGTYEDCDYSLMCHSVGKRVVYEPDAVATHHVAASASETGQYEMPIKKNESIFMEKWGGKFPWSDWMVW